MFEAQFSDTSLNSTVDAAVLNLCDSPQEAQPNRSVRRLIIPAVQSEDLSPVYPPQVLREPLAPIDANIRPQLPQRLINLGPTDEQYHKVGRIVDLGNNVSTTAFACFEVLFSDDEMATGNTSGTRGFQQLDTTKMRFLFSTLQKKFDSPFFNDQWAQIVVRINTKCRGKRRTLIQRLKKHT
jgi:hypothetical protein